MDLTRRLLALALALGLGGTSVPARSVAAASPVRPLAGVRTWVVYYGDAPEAARDLARSDVVVLDPHGHPPLPLVKVHGSLVLTYLNGPAPGIYRFSGGRLVAIERAPTPAPEVPQKRGATKKPAGS